METKIDQKKYLQKYLNPKSKHKKKAKQKTQNLSKRVNIIDDDIDVSQMMPIDSEIDIYTTGEDAPQIAGIIDDRPIDVRLKDKFKFNTQWTLINEDDGFNSKLTVKERKRENKANRTNSSGNVSENDEQEHNDKSDVENVPKRKSRFDNYTEKSMDDRKNSESDNTPPRNQKKPRNDSDPENSRQKNNHSINSKTRNSESDTSPPRKKTTKNYKSRQDSDTSPPRNTALKSESRHHSDSDTSPLRKKTNKNYNSRQDSDNSPSRKKGTKRHSDSDTSPPRKKTNKNNSRDDSDNSPPRKKEFKFDKGSRHHLDSDTNPSSNKANKNYKSRQEDSDTSPPRRKEFKRNKQSRFHSDSDHSPPRKHPRNNEHKSGQNFNTYNRNFKPSNSNRSPPRNRKNETESGNRSPRNKNVVKFNIRNPDQAEQRLEAEKKKIQEEKYATWGKGLKQVEDKKEQMDNESHEMSKPLARYADDADLENYLKDQEREGDPMLEYIRKQKKVEQSDNKSCKPRYEGAFMPNRFGIAPGHRWDGVDRSNGYEANWFNVQNSKKILEDEAYKWSTDDM